MRLAVSTVVGDPGTWRRVARDVEAMGFDVLHLADHLVDGLPAPWSALQAAADATERLVVGNLVLAVDFRHPAILAREAAMLADLSGGRYELGIGAGHMKREWDAVGLPFDSAAERVARLEEAVVVLGRLLDGSGEPVTFAGEHYRLDGYRCWPVPPAPVPILVGGNGDRVLGIAGAHADLVGFTGFGPGADGTRPRLSHFTAGGLADRIATVEAAAAAAGGRRVRRNVLVQQVLVTADRRSGAEALAARYGVGADDVLDSPFVLVGTPDQIAEQLRERTERFGVDTWTVFGDRPDAGQRLDTMAPVIERLR